MRHHGAVPLGTQIRMPAESPLANGMHVVNLPGGSRIQCPNTKKDLTLSVCVPLFSVVVFDPKNPRVRNSHHF